MRIKIGEKFYEIEILELGEGKVKILVNGKEFIFGEKNEEKKIGFAKVFIPKKDFSKKEILAPIDGIISEIFVKEGDFVEKDQKLLLLSAMKMENEILAEFEGKIKKILVKKDQKIKEGDVLVLLE